VPVRIPTDLRRAIDRLAKERGQKRSGVIRNALKHWVGRYQVRTLHTEALTCAIALLADGIERATGKKWIEDPVTAAALREQAERLIFHFAAAPSKPVTVPPEADVVGFLISIIENIIITNEVKAERNLNLPPITFKDDRGLSEILQALSRPPPHGLGSGWRRHQAVRQKGAKS
jgi:predicted transcriptional regulator